MKFARKHGTQMYGLMTEQDLYLYLSIYRKIKIIRITANIIRAGEFHPWQGHTNTNNEPKTNNLKNVENSMSYTVKHST